MIGKAARRSQPRRAEDEMEHSLSSRGQTIIEESCDAQEAEAVIRVRGFVQGSQFVRE